METLNTRFNSILDKVEQVDKAELNDDIREWLQSDVEFVENDLSEPGGEEEYQAYLELTYESLLER